MRRPCDFSWPTRKGSATVARVTVAAYLALGANLGDPVLQIERALEALTRRGVRVRRRARTYRSAPVGPAGQPDYLNTAVEVETELEPLALLETVKAVEAELGRDFETERWGPRVIDIDIALYGDRVVDEPQLRVPHAELTRRRFVLAPLADLAPDLSPPGLPSIRRLLEALEDDPDSVRVLDLASAPLESDDNDTAPS